ncbi:MAG: S8 family serine peptidase [Eubacteriales bacterium]|nr:S8 family serine peptidase [Eubacteriales bacterium]
MKGKNVSLAIIDTVINDEKLNASLICYHYEVLDNGHIRKRDEKDVDITHGTICAEIITSICEKVVIYSIKILDPKGEGTSFELKCALEWCYQNDIEIIHMSLGTTNYHDACIIDDIIAKLISKGTILVAAHHNGGLKAIRHVDREFSVHR